MEGEEHNNFDRKLTSTIGKVMSTASQNEEKTEPQTELNDATPTSSTDASSVTNALQIVGDDPISSTSSDIDQKLKTINTMSNSKDSSCDTEADLLEMSIMSHHSTEKITENVEDLVQDLETLLGESTDSFNLSQKKECAEILDDNASTSSNSPPNLGEKITTISEDDDNKVLDEIETKTNLPSTHNFQNDEVENVCIEASDAENQTIEESKDATAKQGKSEVLSTDLYSSSEINDPQELISDLGVESQVEHEEVHTAVEKIETGILEDNKTEDIISSENISSEIKSLKTQLLKSQECQENVKVEEFDKIIKNEKSDEIKEVTESEQAERTMTLVEDVENIDTKELQSSFEDSVILDSNECSQKERSFPKPQIIDLQMNKQDDIAASEIVAAEIIDPENCNNLLPLQVVTDTNENTEELEKIIDREKDTSSLQGEPREEKIIGHEVMNVPFENPVLDDEKIEEDTTENPDVVLQFESSSERSLEVSEQKNVINNNSNLTETENILEPETVATQEEEILDDRKENEQEDATTISDFEDRSNALCCTDLSRELTESNNQSPLPEVKEIVEMPDKHNLCEESVLTFKPTLVEENVEQISEPQEGTESVDQSKVFHGTEVTSEIIESRQTQATNLLDDISQKIQGETSEHQVQDFSKIPNSECFINEIPKPKLVLQVENISEKNVTEADVLISEGTEIPEKAQKNQETVECEDKSFIDRRNPDENIFLIQSSESDHHSSEIVSENQASEANTFEEMTMNVNTEEIDQQLGQNSPEVFKPCGNVSNLDDGLDGNQVEAPPSSSQEILDSTETCIVQDFIEHPPNAEQTEQSIEALPIEISVQDEPVIESVKSPIEPVPEKFKGNEQKISEELESKVPSELQIEDQHIEKTLPESNETPETDELEETILTVSGLQNDTDKSAIDLQERQLSENEIRDMEALRMAVASITEEVYDTSESLFQPVNEESVSAPAESSIEPLLIPQEKDEMESSENKQYLEALPEETRLEMKIIDVDNQSLCEPLRISVDEDKKEDLEEPTSTRVITPPEVLLPEEVSTTSHSEVDEYKGSLRMTITKQSAHMHSSILKVYNAEDDEQESPIEEPIPKLIIKPKIHQIEQQHSPKVSTRSTSKIASPTPSQRCNSPRITVKSDPLSPLKITIKPVVIPDDKKHSPKLKDDKNKIKEIEQCQAPKITIKPIPKLGDFEEGRSSPKITIKPVLKSEEQEHTERVSSPKISIKPIVKPAEEEEKERIVLKINKGNIPTPSKESKKREYSSDDEKSERLPKMKLKFSKEGGHPHIVQESSKRSNEGSPTPERNKKRRTDRPADDDDIKVVENLNSPIVISDDSRSQHSADGVILDISPSSGLDSNLIMEISKQSNIELSPVQGLTPTLPKKRGRPRKTPLEVRPELPPEPTPMTVDDSLKSETPPQPVHESGRPKRSCRGQNVIATLGIKPRKSRGRGRGAKINMGSREPGQEIESVTAPKLEKEPRLTKAKLKLMQQQTKKQLEEERRLEEITKIKEEARKQLEEQKRREEDAKKVESSKREEIEIINLDDSQQSEEIIIIPDEDEVTKVEFQHQKQSKLDRRRSKRQKLSNTGSDLDTNIAPEEKLKTLEISLTPLGSNNTDIKPHTSMVTTQISEPPTPTSSSEIADIVLVDEETRMSAETSSRAQTPAKSVLLPSENIEESQSSSTTTESSKAKSAKAPRLEIHQETSIDIITADQLAEYSWNNQGTFMIQEQVAQYLGIKSFKRKYPSIARRTVDMQERDFIKEMGLISESMCDLGLTAVNSADILDIMYSDFQDKYEEYCKHQRDRQAKELINKQKALSLAASLEKNRADLTEQVIHSAAQWNANFNKTRREQRKAAMDLQTLTIHYPKGKMKQINKPKIGHYPIALVPGQFTDYYKEYTPTEINNLPLNTMLYTPINIQIPEEFDSESNSESDSDSSSSDSDSSDSSSSSDDCKICTHSPTSKKVVVK